MLTGLIFATAIASQGLAEEADRLNEAYVGCQFAEVRGARERELSASELDALLERSCAPQRRQLFTVFVRLRMERFGDTRAQAEANFASLDRSGREAMIAAYRHR